MDDGLLMAWQDHPDTYTETDAYRTARDAVVDRLRDDPSLHPPDELYPVVAEYTGVDGVPRDPWDLLWAMHVVEDAVDVVWEEQPSADPTAAQLGYDVTGMYYAIDPDAVITE